MGFPIRPSVPLTRLAASSNSFSCLSISNCHRSRTLSRLHRIIYSQLPFLRPSHSLHCCMLFNSLHGRFISAYPNPTVSTYTDTSWPLFRAFPPLDGFPDLFQTLHFRLIEPRIVPLVPLPPFLLPTPDFDHFLHRPFSFLSFVFSIFYQHSTTPAHGFLLPVSHSI